MPKDTLVPRSVGESAQLTGPPVLSSDELVNWWGDDIRWCIDTFGPTRCMFESNYPVDGQTLEYRIIWNAFQKIAAPFTPSEQRALFAETASSVYRF